MTQLTAFASDRAVDLRKHWLRKHILEILEDNVQIKTFVSDKKAVAELGGV